MQSKGKLYQTEASIGQGRTFTGLISRLGSRPPFEIVHGIRLVLMMLGDWTGIPREHMHSTYTVRLSRLPALHNRLCRACHCS